MRPAHKLLKRLLRHRAWDIDWRQTPTGKLRAEGVSHVLGLSEGLSKLIAIDKEPNHQIVHLFRLGKAKGAPHEPQVQGVAAVYAEFLHKLHSIKDIWAHGLLLT